MSENNFFQQTLSTMREKLSSLTPPKETKKRRKAQKVDVVALLRKYRIFLSGAFAAISLTLSFSFFYLDDAGKGESANLTVLANRAISELNVSEKKLEAFSGDGLDESIDQSIDGMVNARYLVATIAGRDDDELLASISDRLENMKKGVPAIRALSEAIDGSRLTETMIDPLFKNAARSMSGSPAMSSLLGLKGAIHSLDYDLAAISAGEYSGIKGLESKLNEISALTKAVEASSSNKEVLRFVALGRFVVDSTTSLVRQRDVVASVQADIRSTKGEFNYAIEHTSQTLGKYSAHNDKFFVWSMVALATAGFLFGLIIFFSVVDSKARALLAEQANQSNEDAIMVLVDDLDVLSQGDLTHKAQVTENITGIIADSLNNTIRKIRKIINSVFASVGDIKDGAAKSADSYARLSAASDNQLREIRDANSAVEMVVESISDVHQAASESALVAKQAIEVTHKGSVATKDTIDGMDNIRDHIQETSKRIKRLGESSQEIGEIVSIVSNIAEQTNVLALNAALQAVSAGEAGKGFAIVAEEVQRLAERSQGATQQISQLVHLIQNDAHDAVAAMEKSTEGVVNGAKLSVSAGKALEEIEEIAQKMASLNNSISVSTQTQTEMATVVMNGMKNILDATEKAKAESGNMQQAVEFIVNSSQALETSVSGFKA